MLGAFRPSAPLSGGLLWKIPWRLSAPQKLRQRRRLRRVDNVVAVLDSALRNQKISSSAHSQSPSTPTPSQTADFSSQTQQSADTPLPDASRATPSELATTAEGQRVLASRQNADLEQRRHGRGPKQGDIMSGGRTSQATKLVSEEVEKKGTTKLIERWKEQMPTEQEMLPKDKYTLFDRKARGYRKGVHKLPKWTRVSQRLNPPGF